MKTRLKIVILSFITVFILSKGISFSDDWKYIGFSEIDKSSFFYVFVNQNRSADNESKINISQKHIFNIKQLLKDGKKYSFAEIERIINCKNRSILTNKITFKNDIGETVDTYINNGRIYYKKIKSKNSVDSAIYQFYCK